MRDDRYPLVKPIEGELLRFHVCSRSRKDIWHLVDVMENACSCEQYAFRVGPQLSRSQSCARCWHLTQARECLLDYLLKQIQVEVDKTQAVAEPNLCANSGA